MQVGVTDLVAKLNAEREAIWLEMPDEVRAIGRGEQPRRAGSHGQYLSALIFAEGEARTLSDEMLWGLWQVAGEDAIDLATLKAIVKAIIGYKASFFDFVGLPRASGLVREYVECVQTCTSIDEFRQLTESALSYANRLHMWVDLVFPWGVCDGFRRTAPADAQV
jgi:Cucumopine synthase C-terminal helical bundle domain